MYPSNLIRFIPAEGSAALDVWAEFHKHFDEDDGSLPEFRLSDMSGAQVVAIVRHLVAAGGRLPPHRDFTCWHKVNQRDARIESVVDAAQSVVDGVCEPFHVGLIGVGVGGRSIPTLGVFVFDDQVCLDYRMGPDWNASSVSAILDLLRHLLAVAPGARLGLDTFGYPEEFFAAWARYLKEVPPTPITP